MGHLQLPFNSFISSTDPSADSLYYRKSLPHSVDPFDMLVYREVRKKFVMRLQQYGLLSQIEERREGTSN